MFSAKDTVKRIPDIFTFTKKKSIAYILEDLPNVAYKLVAYKKVGVPYCL